MRGAAHDDGVEHAHRRAAQQLRGRRGQRGEVQRVAEVVVNPLRPLAEGRVPGPRVPRSRGFHVTRSHHCRPVEDGGPVVVGHGAVQRVVGVEVPHRGLQQPYDGAGHQLPQHHRACAQDSDGGCLDCLDTRASNGGLRKFHNHGEGL